MTSLERAWRGGRSDWKLHLLSVFSVAVAFVCLASALLVVVNVAALRDRWAHSGRASVYLQEGADADAIRVLEQALRDTPGVSTVNFVSSNDARREVLGNGSDRLLASLPAEAFPASLEVSFKVDAGTERLEKLVQGLSVLPAVESVETYQDWSERLGRLLGGGVTAATLLALVVLAAVISVVGSTIRLSLQRRRMEVEVLKVIGATDHYVRRPFLIEGAVQGGVGALVALVILGVLYSIVSVHFSGELGTLVGMDPTFLPWHWVSLMVVLGAVLGVVAAHLSLRRLLLI
jgi:cell division transport system permease protein